MRRMMNQKHMGKKNMIRRILWSMALLMLFGSQVAFAQSPASVQQLVDEIQDLKTRLTWLQYQEAKHEIYIERVKQNIADLEFKEAEALRVRELVGPYMEEVVARLEETVAKDLPFLTDERQRRIKFLKDSLIDHQLQLSQKLRRVFEGLQVEAQYGKDMASTDTTLNISGSDTQVSLLRLGRVAMYYLSLDNTLVGRWNDETQGWEALDERFVRPVRRVLDMAERKRSVQLIELPLPASE